VTNQQIDRLTWQHFRRGAVRMWIDSFTTSDGKTFDVGRILGFWSIATFIFLATWDVLVKGHEFHMQDFGVGLGALMAAMGALLKLKETTEPKTGA